MLDKILDEATNLMVVAGQSSLMEHSMKGNGKTDFGMEKARLGAGKEHSSKENMFSAFDVEKER